MGITLRKKRFIGILIAILLPWLFPQAADAASAAVIQLEAEQVFTRPGGCRAADTFTYTLTAEDSGCPMPDGSSGDIFTFTMSGTEAVTIGTITYRTIGTYNYIIRQTMEPEQRGFTYDAQSTP